MICPKPIQKMGTPSCPRLHCSHYPSQTMNSCIFVFFLWELNIANWTDPPCFMGKLTITFDWAIFNGKLSVITRGYPLVMTNSSLLNMAIEIVNVPIKKGGSFYSCLYVYLRVYPYTIHSYPSIIHY